MVPQPNVVEQEAKCFKLLIAHGSGGALRELVKQNEGHAPAVALLLLAHGATIDEDEHPGTLEWARARYAEAVEKGEDLSACSRLVAQLVQLQPASSSSSGAEDSEAQEEAQRIASGASQQEHLSNGRPPAWGSDPVPCVRAVLRHVLQNYTREAMRKIATHHIDNATALLAVAAGCGPPVRDVVHFTLALGAKVDGLVLRQRRRRARQPSPQQLPTSVPGTTQQSQDTSPQQAAVDYSTSNGSLSSSQQDMGLGAAAGGDGLDITPEQQQGAHALCQECDSHSNSHSSGPLKACSTCQASSGQQQGDAGEAGEDALCSVTLNGHCVISPAQGSDPHSSCSDADDHTSLQGSHTSLYEVEEEGGEGDGCAFLEYLSAPAPRSVDCKKQGPLLSTSSKQGFGTLPVSKPAALGGRPECAGGGQLYGGQGPASEAYSGEGDVEEGEEEEEEDGKNALSPLAEAAAAGDRYLVELLLEVHGANPTAHGNLAERVARAANHHGVAKMIFDKAVALRAARGQSAGQSDPSQGVTGSHSLSDANSDTSAGSRGMNGTHLNGSHHGSAAMYKAGAAHAGHTYVTLGDYLESVMPTWVRRMMRSWQTRSSKTITTATSRTSVVPAGTVHAAPAGPIITNGHYNHLPEAVHEQVQPRVYRSYAGSRPLGSPKKDGSTSKGSSGDSRSSVSTGMVAAGLVVGVAAAGALLLWHHKYGSRDRASVTSSSGVSTYSSIAAGSAAAGGAGSGAAISSSVSSKWS